MNYLVSFMSVVLFQGVFLTAAFANDPFDKSICQGQPMTSAQALNRISDGQSDLGTISEHLRRRVCDKHGNCEHWKDSALGSTWLAPENESHFDFGVALYGNLSAWLERVNDKAVLRVSHKTSQQVVEVGTEYATWALAKQKTTAHAKSVGFIGESKVLKLHPLRGDWLLESRDEKFLPSGPFVAVAKILFGEKPVQYTGLLTNHCLWANFKEVTPLTEDSTLESELVITGQF